jgi:membrane protease YdiL (CAAX protease family)
MTDVQIEDFLNKDEQQHLEEGLIPAKWQDLVIYILGGFGMYLIASLAIGLFFTEITLVAVILISVLNFLVLAGSVYLLGIKRKKLSWTSLGLIAEKFSPKHAIVGAGLAVLLLIPRGIAGFFGLLIERVVTGEISSLAMRENLFSVGFDSWYGILLMVIGIGILAPIAEELFFRGLLYDFFRQKVGVTWAVVLSASMFGLAHFDSLAVVLSTFVMGVVMAISVEYTKSLWMTIWMHIATNSGAVVMMAIVLKFQDLLPDLLEQFAP